MRNQDQGRGVGSLDAEETRRYGRHLVLPEVGLEGQERLKQARVLVLGAGGLGSPVALYLAAAGIGTLGLMDFDQVDVTNLQRQVLYRSSDIGRSKVRAAAEHLGDLNPKIRLVEHEGRLTSENALEFFATYDVIVDGSDNFPTRYLSNDAAILTGKPLVYGAIFRFEGQVSVFGSADGPCYRCLFEEPPPPGSVPSCAEAGVLGVLPGIIGCVQANEALKLVLGLGSPLVGRLLLFDALATRFREVRIPKNSRCPICSETPTIRQLIDYEAFCAGPDAKPETPTGPETLADLPFAIQARELAGWLEEGRSIELIDVRTPREWEICRLEGAKLIPLAELAARHQEVSRDRVVVVNCHHGIRSAQAVGFLRDAGVAAINLTGGIEAWSLEVDPSVPRY